MPSDVATRYQPPLVTVSGGVVSTVHTVLGFIAFLGALVTALALHYERIVKNHVAGYPQEYWPSVSATIGDWFPERNIFQVGIALMAGPRFLLVFLSALLVSLATPSGSKKAAILLIVGTARTFACGGWVYVTSSDHHDFHDIAMAAYLLLTPPWMYITSGSLAPQPNKYQSTPDGDRDSVAAKARKMRRLAATLFFSCMPPMGLFFYRHNVLRIPGAYSQYAFFEWGLIIFDLLFDAASVYDLSRLELHVIEAPKTIVAAGSPAKADSAAKVGGAWFNGGKAEAFTTGAWSTVPADFGVKKEPAGVQTKEAGTSKRSAYRDAKSPENLSTRDLVSLGSECYLVSVYNMGIGGHEALLVSQVIGLGLTLAMPPLRRPAMDSIGGIAHVGRLSNRPQSLMWLLSLAGIASWWIDSALYRLLAVAFSNAVLAVLLAVDWGASWESGQLTTKVAVWLVGLLLSNLAKYANHSNNPAWPFLDSTNGGLNPYALALGVLCTLEIWTRPRKEGRPAINFRSANEGLGSFWKASIGTGVLLYALHAHLTDTGTLIAWGWTGYPVTGPTAIQYGSVILSAMAASTLIRLGEPRVATSPLLVAVHAISAYLLKWHTDWVSFVGAAGFAFTLPPLAFPLIAAAMRHNPLKVMLASWLVANVLVFVGILTVAYAFVPGGKIMRERTGFMLALQVVLLAVGQLNAREANAIGAPPSNDKEAEKASSAASSRPFEGVSGFSKYLGRIMAAIVIASNIVPAFRFVEPSSIEPYHAPDRLVTAGMWTVHFALDQHMLDSSRRMSSIIKHLDLDIIGLVETDLHRPVFGNRDLTQFLAEDLGMYADIGPSPKSNTWGAVLLSKFEIINSTHHLLPSPNGELAPAIHAVLDIYGVHTHVIVSHNGQEEDPLDRELQTTEIARILREAYPHPAIFLGYVVTKPHAERPAPYKILFEEGRIHDVEVTDMNRWCQYLGFRGLQRIGYARVSRYTVTDTELQTMKLVVPEHPIDPDRNDLTMFVAAETYPESMRYPVDLIDPEAKVYDRHKYSPYLYPIFYAKP
ncbi:related to CWH43 - putative sensor/transporter protein [Pseudozyma flocculosa]|uniref:Related to CWH43 - putative sensor/transporter protein n=1 Tax=Pseudozyma flocculosa TaxID=84751 RepID=A0A5C3EUH8_9BASI|nr:related to CWH43 - putative sensor/transporter protein [Pseudozyma flocculosa]